jgi:hypothetical protein
VPRLHPSEVGRVKEQACELISARAGDDANCLANLSAFCHPYLSQRELVRMWECREPVLFLAPGESQEQVGP